MKLCEKPISANTRFEKIINRRCFNIDGHSGRCSEYPYLTHLDSVAKNVSNKIKRDATKTTGAPWKSADAGPNRIDRWAMTLSDEDLLDYGVDMSQLKPGVQNKLREKAATYDECMVVAAYLTWLVYQFAEAPTPPKQIREYLEARFGSMTPGSGTCLICKGPLNFTDFELAQRGKAPIETAHANPRYHNTSNVGFAHRECNIAQGNLTLDQFYSWLRDILYRVGWISTAGSHKSTS